MTDKEEFINTQYNNRCSEIDSLSNDELLEALRIHLKQVAFNEVVDIANRFYPNRGKY